MKKILILIFSIISVSVFAQTETVLYIPQKATAYRFISQDSKDLESAKSKNYRWIVDYTTRDKVSISANTIVKVVGFCNLKPSPEYDTYIIYYNGTKCFLSAGELPENPLIEAKTDELNSSIAGIEAKISSLNDQMNQIHNSLSDVQKETRAEHEALIAEYNKQIDSLNAIRSSYKSQYDAMYEKEEQTAKAALDAQKKKWEASLTATDKQILGMVGIGRPEYNGSYVHIRVYNNYSCSIVGMACTCTVVDYWENVPSTVTINFSEPATRLNPGWSTSFYSVRSHWFNTASEDDIKFQQMSIKFEDGKRINIYKRQFDLMNNQPDFTYRSGSADHSASSQITTEINGIDREIREIKSKIDTQNTIIASINQGTHEKVVAVQKKVDALASEILSNQSTVLSIKSHNCMGSSTTSYTVQSEPYRNYNREIYTVPIGMGIDVDASFSAMKGNKGQFGMDAYAKFGNQYNRLNCDLGLGFSTFKREIDRVDDEAQYASGVYVPIFARMQINLLSHERSSYAMLQPYLVAGVAYNAAKGPYVPPVSATFGVGVSMYGGGCTLYVRPFFGDQLTHKAVSDTRIGFTFYINMFNKAWGDDPKVRKMK